MYDNGTGQYGGGEYEHAQRRQRADAARIERADSRQRDLAAKREVQARGLNHQTLASGMTWNQVLSSYGFNWSAALQYWDQQREFERNPHPQGWYHPPQGPGPMPPYGPGQYGPAQYDSGPQERYARDSYQQRREEDFVEQVEARMAWEYYEEARYRMEASMKNALWEQHQESLRQEARRAAERELRYPFKRAPDGDDPRDQ